jgi:predicted patatin/cPLA2 family phospholipase
MHPIVDILRARAARGSRAPHGDGARVALAVEGGAMRGVVSAGMVSALEALGLTHAFDAVYGTSAGAFNSAYFLAGQAELGTRIYSEDISNRAFADMRRALGSRPVVNVDFVVDVMTRAKPLDAERLMANPTPLTVMATDAATGERAAFRAFADRADLMAAMRAGATMPILAGGPFAYRGREYFDASLSEPIPVPIAEAEGFTHVLALLTRPPLHQKRLSSLVERLIVTRPLRRLSPMLAERFENRGVAYSALLATIDGGHSPAGRSVVLGLRPEGDEVSKLERRRDVLLAAAESGRVAVMRAIGQLGN